MTEDQIERAARALCRMRGLDPDGIVGHDAPVGPSGYQPGVMLCSPRWQLVAREIRTALQIQQAIQEATSEPAGAAEPDQEFVTAEEKRLMLDLQKAEELLGWAARFMRSVGAFGAAEDNRNELVERIQRFLGRRGT
jgi:hypothetical protein